ncbi:MAG TPA: hypothetical protein VGK97_04870 [Spongiibacteraceae bacterium]|jgi:low affinity Fe/Cu permease
MTKTLWIVLGISVLAIIGFVLVIRSQLLTNKEIDKNIDYSKLRPLQDDEEDNEK